MTKKIICDECGEVEFGLVDGYDIGDRLLEGVYFEVRIKNGKYVVNVRADAKKYFDGLNTKKWLKDIKDYAKKELEDGNYYEVVLCCKCQVCPVYLEGNRPTDEEISERFKKEIKQVPLLSFNDFKGKLAP